MKDGFIRVAAATPDLKVADPVFNREQTWKMMQEAAARDVKILVFPELGLTGYTCSDLFLQDTLIDQAKDIQTQIDETFRTAYAALQKANMEIGIAFVDQISHTVPVENSIRIKTRSVMGTEIPLVEYDKKAGNTPTYAYYSTKLSLDEAKAAFERVKELSIQLSMIENAAIRLATNIKKTQKRANALKNITIPRYETLTRDITNALEEKEREEFTRLKVIKRMKQNS